MAAIRIRTTLVSDTVTLPELKPLIGKTVEIRVVEAKPGKPRRRRPTEPVPTLEEVRAALASIPGSMTADFIAERGERLGRSSTPAPWPSTTTPSRPRRSWTGCSRRPPAGATSHG